MMKFHSPLPLKPNDKVAILSPSSGMPYLFPWVYEQGLNRIREIFNLEVIEYPTAKQSPSYLSDNPKARADDINQAFADPSIKAIIATTGGNDQIRILPFLNQTVISANPKIFMGYSDNTNLHLFLWGLGIVSFYGGSVMTQFGMGGGMDAYTIDSIKKTLFKPPVGQVFAATDYSDEDLDWADKNNLTKKRTMHVGQGWCWYNKKKAKIKGTLWGGDA